VAGFACDLMVFPVANEFEVKETVGGHFNPAAICLRFLKQADRDRTQGILFHADPLTRWWAMPFN